MEAILHTASEWNVPVLEDAAQAIGATSPDGRGAGSMGAFGAFSFFPSKNLGGIGDGGMVVTSDDALAQKVRTLRVHGSKPKYHHALIGGNFRLDAIQAAALLVKLEHLEGWHQLRRQRAAYYDQALATLGRPEVRVPAAVCGAERHIYNQYVVSVSHDRDGLMTYLRESGISTAVYYPVPLHLQLCFQDLGYSRGDFPNSELAAAHSLALPLYPEITSEMQDYVVAKIGQFFVE